MHVLIYTEMMHCSGLYYMMHIVYSLYNRLGVLVNACIPNTIITTVTTYSKIHLNLLLFHLAKTFLKIDPPRGLHGGQ